MGIYLCIDHTQIGAGIRQIIQVFYIVASN